MKRFLYKEADVVLVVIKDVPDTLYERLRDRAAIQTGGDLSAMILLILAEREDAALFEQLLKEAEARRDAKELLECTA